MDSLICFRCLAVNRRDELRPSKKIKGLTAEQSRKMKCCKRCWCRTFF